ncbi:glyoxal oxidase precursor [Roridomyces roridus]|uniref:Glyoxal oxidase n=1 Tax=Roridomyces roridus TaxID=1738132 RepID=A0AAD7C192_9AGAR|nr:glyoxal oxidase precursor [Roridomyces roridus]
MLSLLLTPLLLLGAVTAQRTIEWTFVQNGTSGVIPVELITLSPTLMLQYDRADGNPLLLPNGEKAWAALWHLENNTATPLDTITDTFCAGGAFISNGTLVSVAGQPLEDPGQPPADGRMGIRLFGPCTSPDGSGAGCTVFEDPANIHLAVTRWYPTGLRIPDGSLMIIGGSNTNTFYNTGPTTENSIEFFPSRPGEAGTVRPSQFLVDAEPVSLFPRSFVLPSGHVFVIANNISMIYDVETNTELMRLPDIPNGVRVANPFDGTGQLLPLIPPLYEPTVLVCGGSAADDRIPAANLSTLDPATDQCSRITLTADGVKKGWEVETMPEQRILMESVMLPSGDVLLINGAHTGYSGYPSVGGSNATGSNSANPAERGMLYRTGTQFQSGQRITQEGIPTSGIPRMYHSSASITALGNIMVAGSNPHPAVVEPPTNLSFPTEFRVQYLNPDFITNGSPRPAIRSAPTQVAFNQKVRLTVSIPAGLSSGDVQVSLMDLGYVTHAQHSNSRLVVLQHTLLGNVLEITTPPNNNIYPPGPAWLFLVVDGVWSQGVQVMVGDGGNPPRAAQGSKVTFNSL